MLAQALLKLIAARRQIGEQAGQFAKRFFRPGKRRVRRRNALGDADQPRVGFLRHGFEGCFLGVEASKRRRGVGRQRPLALQIRRELLDAAIELADALLGPRLFAFERFPRDDEPLQGGCGPGLGLAQGRQTGSDLCLLGRRLRVLAGARRDDANAFVLATLGLGDFGLGGDPA